MDLGFLILSRVILLSGERVAFHGLGRRANSLAVTMAAYGGAAAVLWTVTLLTGPVHWVGAAFWPGAVYAASFTLYTAALSAGPVGVVSGFANLTVPMLFFWDPRWDGLSLAALALFLAGSVALLPAPTRLTRPVAWMILSGVALAAGRLIDRGNLSFVSLPYAASLYTAVMLWLVIPATAYGAWVPAWKLVRGRPGWMAGASIFNALSYVTALELLRLVTPAVVEAVSSTAGLGATLVGSLWFREGRVVQKTLAAGLMAVATVLMLFSQWGGIR